MKNESKVKYYVDLEWTDSYGDSYSYESEPEVLFDTKEEAEEEVKKLTKSMPLKENEFYCVCEIETEE